MDSKYDIGQTVYFVDGPFIRAGVVKEIAPMINSAGIAYDNTYTLGCAIKSDYKKERDEIYLFESKFSLLDFLSASIQGVEK